MRRWVSVFAVFVLSAWAFGQNAVIETAKSFGEKGVAAAKAPASSPTKFKPSSSTAGIDRFIKELDLGADDAKSTKALLVEFLKGYNGNAEKLGSLNDAAGAYANTLAVLKTIVTEEEFDDNLQRQFLGALQAAFDIDSVRRASDAQKQEAHDYAISTMGLALITAQGATDRASMDQLKKLADVLCQNLIGAPTTAIKIQNDQVSIAGKASPTPPPASAGLATGFTFSKPEGWVESQGWHMASLPTTGVNDTTRATALIRFLPAVPKGKNGGEILNDLWKTAIPKEIPFPGGMVFRRYVGNKIPSWFMFARGREKDRRADTLFTLMIVDCGAAWQPVVIAQTYDDTGMFSAGVDFSAQYSYPKTAELADQFLTSFRCAATSGQPLADRGALTGNFNFGSYGSMDYVNVYTGSSSTSYVSYGGELNLKGDGTFTYVFKSASSNMGSAAQFGQVTGKGQWSIQGDRLVAKFSEYKQWSSNNSTSQTFTDKVNTYIIAGVTTYSDGVKIAVLIYEPPGKPVNATTVGDRGDWFSTKKAK